MRLRRANVVDFVEQEGKGERYCLSDLLLHLAVLLLVLAAPVLRDDQEKLDVSLEPVKPDLRERLRISLLDRDANDVHQSTHERAVRLLEHVPRGRSHVMKSVHHR